MSDLEVFLIIVLIVWLIIAWRYCLLICRKGECGADIQERGRSPKRTQQTRPSTSRTINYDNSGPPYPLGPYHPQPTQLPTSERSDNSSSGPPYPLGPHHPQPALPSTSERSNNFNSVPLHPIETCQVQSNQPVTIERSNNSNSGPPYPVVPLHPMANDDNNSNSTNLAIGFIIPPLSESQPASAPQQTPPPSYEVATSSPFSPQHV